jgi:hypothetical protein
LPNGNRTTIDIDRLLLDKDNPRLPEELQGANQAAILEYLYNNASLDELARSFVDNGFFEHEPLIVAAENDHYVVLEGNRRLGALKVLLGEPEAEGLEIDLDGDVPAEDVARLHSVPCFVVDDRDDVHKYLGFRHIGGIKKWSAEAKARYVTAEVDRVAAAGSDQPFRDVARRVGSNVQGIRNSYVAMAALRVAKREFSVPIEHVEQRRFGVWLRAMNSPELRDYVGLGTPRTYQEIRETLPSLHGDQLAEVIADMSPQDGTGRAVLADSRDVTTYAQILTNRRAHSVLRRYRDFELAKQIVVQADIPVRIRQLARSVQLVIDEVSRMDERAPDVQEAAEELASLSRALLAIARVDSENA